MSGDMVCPVAALAAYLVVRGQSRSPFFRFASGVPLSREVLVTRVRAALRPSGLDVSLYSGHSFWIGAATTAAAVGIEDSLVKTRWAGGKTPPTSSMCGSRGSVWPVLLDC